MKIIKEFKVTELFLNKEPDRFFVFGDNVLHKGTGGAASLRHHPRAIGFITKKFPNNKPDSFYNDSDYWEVFHIEMRKLKKVLIANLNATFYISKLGAGLANRNSIFEKIIEPNLFDGLKYFKNVKLLWG